MTVLRPILGDQLSASISSLDGVAPGDVILMCEVMEEAIYVRRHPKKIAFLFSAMRHFEDAYPFNALYWDFMARKEA